MEHSADADSAGQADVSEETISGQNVDVRKTHLPGIPGCDPVLSLAASSPAEVSASFSSSKAAGPAVSAPAAASSSSSQAAGPAMPGSSGRRSIEDDSAPRLEIPRRQAEQAQEPSSMFNLSTVWLGNIPIVKRTDKSSVAYYTTRPCHKSTRVDVHGKTKERKCKKEITVSADASEPLVIKMLAWWLSSGFKLVQREGEDDEALRKRHVSMAPPKTDDELPSLEEMKQEIVHYEALSS